MALALNHNERILDLLALALKVLLDEGARTIDNLTHLASACKSYTRTNPISDERVTQVMTRDFIQHVIIPEICDNLAMEYVLLTLGRGVKEIWDSQHPTQSEIPETIQHQLIALYSDDSQHWRESVSKADALKREWDARRGIYQGQYDYVLGTIGGIYRQRIGEDIRERPRRARQ